MRIRLGELRRLLVNSFSPQKGSRRIELSRPPDNDDQYDFDEFILNVVSPLKDQGAFPFDVGAVIGNGFEGVVCSSGSDKVVKLIPTYNAVPGSANAVIERLNNAPSGGLYVKIFDVGEVNAIDTSSGDTYTALVYALMERLEPLSTEDEEAIQVVIQHELRPEEVDNPRLGAFLKRYMSLRLDHDVRNVMKRGDQYVIIDPE